MPLHLTQDDLREFTGKDQWAAMRRALDKMEVKWKPRADGFPLVRFSDYDLYFDGKPSSSRKVKDDGFVMPRNSNPSSHSASK